MSTGKTTGVYDDDQHQTSNYKWSRRESEWYSFSLHAEDSCCKCKRVEDLISGLDKEQAARAVKKQTYRDCEFGGEFVVIGRLFSFQIQVEFELCSRG